ncbi:MAG: hypothetical protein ACLU9S_12180 [Oscillospiraceae bacterium]
MFIAGGIGLAPARSVITLCPGQRRDQYGQVDDRLRLPLQGGPGGLSRRSWSEWCREDGRGGPPDHRPRAGPGWDGHVGFVPSYVQELGFATGTNRR